MITEKKYAELHEEMQRLGVEEKELIETFTKGSGKGGQKTNKANTCVMLRHTPSNYVIRCQKTRSREDNRFFARRMLCKKLRDAQR